MTSLPDVNNLVIALICWQRRIFYQMSNSLLIWELLGSGIVLISGILKRDWGNGSSLELKFHNTDDQRQLMAMMMCQLGAPPPLGDMVTPWQWSMLRRRAHTDDDCWLCSFMFHNRRKPPSPRPIFASSIRLGNARIATLSEHDMDMDYDIWSGIWNKNNSVGAHLKRLKFVEAGYSKHTTLNPNSKFYLSQLLAIMSIRQNCSSFLPTLRLYSCQLSTASASLVTRRETMPGLCLVDCIQVRSITHWFTISNQHHLRINQSSLKFVKLPADTSASKVFEVRSAQSLSAALFNRRGQ